MHVLPPSRGHCNCTDQPFFTGHIFTDPRRLGIQYHALSDSPAQSDPSAPVEAFDTRAFVAVKDDPLRPALGRHQACN